MKNIEFPETGNQNKAQDNLSPDALLSHNEYIFPEFQKRDL
jgi:hypothetical protein